MWDIPLIFLGTLWQRRTFFRSCHKGFSSQNLSICFTLRPCLTDSVLGLVFSLSLCHNGHTIDLKIVFHSNPSSAFLSLPILHKFSFALQLINFQLSYNISLKAASSSQLTTAIFCLKMLTFIILIANNTFIKCFPLCNIACHLSASYNSFLNLVPSAYTLPLLPIFDLVTHSHNNHNKFFSS